MPTGPREPLSQITIPLGPKVQLEVRLSGSIFLVDPEFRPWLEALLGVLDESPPRREK
jgi:hypothetical protein